MTIFESLLFREFLTDINAQPNIFHKDLFRDSDNPPNDFSFDLYYFVKAVKSNLKIVRFPVRFLERKYGTSHWNISIKSKIKFIIRTLRYSFKLNNEYFSQRKKGIIR